MSLLKRVFARLSRQSRWVFMADLIVGDGAKVKVGQEWMAGWDLLITGPAGIYTVEPVPTDRYHQKTGKIKGEIRLMTYQGNWSLFHKRKDGTQRVKVWCHFMVDRPGTHSTSFIILDPKGRELSGPGFIYKEVVAE